MSYLFLNSISGGEIILVFLFILIFFGADKIPSFARTFGRAIRQMRDATQSIQDDIQSSANEVKKDFNKIQKDVEKETGELKDRFKDQTGL
ncbi:Sec-independent protein translocase subunit TatA/TatB [Luteibaculum oceani]|uniref:Twin-arginine translocase TatA/TatE family subunit n=1 Tax=Luteibaculum oceani TaxID=1294296 RepID=A0A5C6VA61_9FLAO|nr:twin-arginine translocase TatA/TatE family subunit [Luteibaculum oceani]TXC81644.1 twin-arginine translocase TatA/TatE family subunit [Luteibaculum oceani]